MSKHAPWTKEQAQDLAAAISKEEQQRKYFLSSRNHSCVPWRGAGGEIGNCIYCGNKVEGVREVEK